MADADVVVVVAVVVAAEFICDAFGGDVDKPVYQNITRLHLCRRSARRARYQQQQTCDVTRLPSDETAIVVDFARLDLLPVLVDVTVDFDAVRTDADVDDDDVEVVAVVAFVDDGALVVVVAVLDDDDTVDVTDVVDVVAVKLGVALAVVVVDVVDVVVLDVVGVMLVGVIAVVAVVDDAGVATLFVDVLADASVNVTSFGRTVARDAGAAIGLFRSTKHRR